MNSEYLNKIVDLRNIQKRIQKYYGFVIWDTYNNPVFPILYPKFDESNFFYPEYLRKYYTTYTKKEVDILPWHFFIEFINNKYLIYNTRPFNYMFPLKSSECLNLASSNNIELNNHDKNVFSEINVEDYIHIVILGDSNSDIYTNDIYFKIGKFIIAAYRNNMYGGNSIKIDNEVYLISMGNNFNQNLIMKYL